MIKNFVDVLPESKTFRKHLDYEFPNLDQFYDEYLEVRKHSEFDQFEQLNLHDTYLTLIIDTFNLSTSDPYLQQLSMNLIARYYSERGELVRNMERILILFNEQEFRMYTAIRTALDKFNILCERSEVS